MKKVFLVHFDEALVTAVVALNIQFSYSGTQRRYVEIALAAATLGALIRIDDAIISTGFSYADASCYPSAEHVNGEAMDTSYLTTNADTVQFITALNDYGYRLYRIGLHKTQLATLLNAIQALNGRIRQDTQNLPNSTTSLHDSHLHSTDVTLIDGDKIL